MISPIGRWEAQQIFLLIKLSIFSIYIIHTMFYNQPVFVSLLMIPQQKHYRFLMLSSLFLIIHMVSISDQLSTHFILLTYLIYTKLDLAQVTQSTLVANVIVTLALSLIAKVVEWFKITAITVPPVIYWLVINAL